MFILSIIILVLVGLYVILGSIRQKKLLINKGVVIIAVVAVGLLFFSSRFGNDESKTEVQYYQEIAPSIQAAPYMVLTPSRAYYIATFQDDDSYLVLTNFYYYDKGKKWVNTDVPLHLDKNLQEYSNIKVLKRGG